MDHYTVKKILDQVSDVLWSKLSLNHLSGFWTWSLSLKIYGIFLLSSAAQMENTFVLNVLQELDHCFTIAIFSLVLQGVADSESRCILKDIGAYGKQSDGTFSASTLYHFLEDFESALQKSLSLERSGTEMPSFILGVETYPLKTNLMKPFARKDLSRERVFNYRLSRSRS
jgi:hypothetical protein